MAEVEKKEGSGKQDYGSFQVVNVNEYEALAKERLPKMAYDFYAGGAEDEWTLRQNKSAFTTIRFFHRKPKALAIFRSYNKLEILRLAKIRFAYMIIVMRHLIKVKDSLRLTVMLDAWKAWPGSKEPDALKVQQNAFHPDMWNLAESLMTTLQPIYNVLRLTDKGGCTLGLIYEFMDKVGELLNQDSTPGIRPERLRPQVLVDVRNVDLSTSILGHAISMPILIAPTAMHKMAHPDGEIGTAKAAAKAKTIMIYKNRKMAETLVHRAEVANYKAIVLTADVPRLGRREADARNKFFLPPPLTMKNMEGFLPLEMDKDIGWLKSITKLPILLKGVLNALDAELAIQFGISGIIVSNHGGRQLDYVLPSISALEEVVRAVRGRVPVLLDGGIRRGTDIFKALALGAQAVLIGRPVIFGLAVNGEAGVSHVLEMLRNELELTMSLVGCCSLKDIKRSHAQLQTQRSVLAKL